MIVTVDLEHQRTAGRVMLGDHKAIWVLDKQCEFLYTRKGMRTQEEELNPMS